MSEHPLLWGFLRTSRLLVLVIVCAFQTVFVSPSDAQTGIVAFSQSAYSVIESNFLAPITLIRTGSTTATGSVDFVTKGGTAINGVDYTAKSGTVVFASGVLTNTFSIAILGDPALDTDETVKLKLVNPRGAIKLGNQTNSVLTILDQGAPELDLSEANFRVLRHTTPATVTVLRLGNSSGAASVAYATSDGSATDGVDYLGASGTLDFAPGDVAKSFSFPVINHQMLESNKTVNVALSNAVGIPMGPLSNAVVTIVNDRPQTITLTDVDGDLVTLTLKKAGTMDVTQGSTNVDIVLSSTDATSLLTILVTQGTNGDGFVDIGKIEGDGGCGRIDAPSADLVGSGINLADYLGRLRIHDIRNGAAVVAGGTSTQKTRIQTHDIPDGSSINLGSKLTSLQAVQFGGGDISAASLGNLSIGGDKLLGITGIISNTVIIVTNGNVDSISAQRMVDSVVYVGFTPTIATNPLVGGVFVSNLMIKGVHISGRTNAFENTYIAAAKIGSVSLASVAITNGGIAFGILADQSISAVSVKSPSFAWKRKGATDQSVLDFHVKH